MVNRYPAILRAIGEATWAILPEKGQAIAELLEAKAAGREVDPGFANIVLADGGERKQPFKVGSVMVIPVWGTLTYRADSFLESSGVTSTQRITSWLRAALADADVKSIVLDINSPGGTVPGVMELADEVRAARDVKRIVAFSNWLAASAAYWVAAQGSELVILPSGMVGSVGVFNMHVDYSESLAKEGIKVTFTQAGRFKTEESPYKPLSEEAQASIQARVDAQYDEFVKGVAKGRGVTPAKVRSDYGEGRVFRGAEAVRLGMADRVGTMDSILERLNRGKQGGRLQESAEAVTPGDVAQALRKFGADLRSAKER